MDATRHELLTRARDGCAESWQELDKLYRPFVIGELRRILARCRGSDAEDIAQEVFQVLFLRLPGYQTRGVGSFRAFLREITRRQALAWLRRRQPSQFPMDFNENELFHRLQQWADHSSDLSRLWDEAHRQYWKDRIWDEAERRCQHSLKLVRYFAIYRAVYVHQQLIADAAREHDISLSTAYRALAEIQALINALRLEWAPLMDLDEA